MSIVFKSDKIENIPTKQGNDLLTQFQKEGWVVTKEYGEDMVDKGIDFDSYRIERDTSKLDFSWSNWDGWTIEGDSDSLSTVSGLLGVR